MQLYACKRRLLVGCHLSSSLLSLPPSFIQPQRSGSHQGSDLDLWLGQVFTYKHEGKWATMVLGSQG